MTDEATDLGPIPTTRRLAAMACLFLSDRLLSLAVLTGWLSRKCLDAAARLNARAGLSLGLPPRGESKGA